MKDLLINSIMNNIKKEKKYDESKLSIIRYGLSSLYLHITKLVVILTLAYILGIIVSLLKLLLFYSILRLTAFGLHAKKSSHCWITSITVFLLIPYLCENITINKYIMISLLFICYILIAIYAPADTEKRPLIHKKKRIIFKIITLITTTVYIVMLFFIKDNILRNIVFFSIILQTTFILPITYKIFGVKYGNYKSYKMNERRKEL